MCFSRHETRVIPVRVSHTRLGALVNGDPGSRSILQIIESVMVIGEGQPLWNGVGFLVEVHNASVRLDCSILRRPARLTGLYYLGNFFFKCAVVKRVEVFAVLAVI